MKLLGFFFLFLPWFYPVSYLLLIPIFANWVRRINSKGLSGRIFDPRSSPFNTSLLVFAIAVTISVILSSHLLLSLGAFVLFLFYLLVLLVTRRCAREKKEDTLLNFIFLGAAVAIGFGILQVIFNINFKTHLFTLTLKFSTEGGLTSTFYNPNWFASYLVLFLPLLFSTLRYQGKERKALWGAFLAMGIICLVLTRSLGGIGAFYILLLIFVWRRTWKWGLGLSALTAALVIFKFDLLLRAIELYSTPENRVYTWESVIWTMVKDRPFFGTGLATYPRVVSTYSSNPFVLNTHAHNLYLNYLAEIGIFGFVSLMSVVLIFFKNCVARLHDKNSKGILEGCVLSVSGALIHGSTETVINNFVLGIVFFSLIGLGMGIVERKTKSRRPGEI